MIMAYAIPEDYGAVGDGTTDDTSAMQNFVDDLVATGLEGHLTGGKTYLITAPGTDTVILDIDAAIRLYGNGATIRVADDSTGFHAILGSKDSGDDLSGLWIEGVVFDHNAQNEDGEPTVSTALLILPRCTVKAKRGAGLAVIDCVVLNSVSTNCIELNGDGNSSDTRVRGCRFYMAEPNGDVYFDHSTLYLTGDNIEVVDNYFENASWGSANGTCAIEVHPGTQYAIGGNRIVKYHTGVNIAGVYDTDSVGGVVTGNLMETLRRGIAIYSSPLGGHDDAGTDWGIDGLVIDANDIIVRNELPLGNMTGGGISCFGIAMPGGAGLPLRDIVIGDANLISFREETSEPDWTGISGGIGFGQAPESDILFENIRIGGTIVNAPIVGVAIGFGGGVFKNCFIDVKLIRPGSSASTDAGLDPFRCGLNLQPHQLVGKFSAKLDIVDAEAATKLRSAVNIFSFDVDPGAGVTQSLLDSTGAIVELDVELVITGTRSTFNGMLVKNTDLIIPLLRGRQNFAFAGVGAWKCRAGSQVIDSSLNRRHFVYDELVTSWPVEYDVYVGTGTPTDTYPNGSIIHNVSVAAGGHSRFLRVGGAWKYETTIQS
jgi:hypothetical protein